MTAPLSVQLTLHPEYTIGETDSRLFDSFIEHLGRAVYTGIYEPEHPLADQQGFRREVLDSVRELNSPIARYPGGNLRRATIGIGLRAQRPRRFDLAWATTEPNWVGTDEFVDWARKANTEAMMAVNSTH